MAHEASAVTVCTADMAVKQESIGMEIEPKLEAEELRTITLYMDAPTPTTHTPA